MSQNEAWTFVKLHFKMVLCTLDSEGFPHAAPIWYVILNDKIYFRAQPYKKKIKNILNRPQVCGVVEDGDKYTELRGVMVRGLAKVVDTDKELRKEVFELLAEKYSRLRNTQRFPKAWRESYGKEHRVVVELRPTSVVSWDNRKWINPTAQQLHSLPLP
jgi:nitroimidazol reductase NimA-like FMN-containing flavoprotein (pyridoxamine 5'-phosphate oxidase superfamily)